MAENDEASAALSYTPSRPGEYLRQSRLLAQAGRHDAARSVLDEAVARFPAHHELAADRLFRAAQALQRDRVPAAGRLALRDEILAQPIEAYGAAAKLRAVAALIELPDIAAARHWLASAVDDCRTTGEISVAARLIPIVFECAERVPPRLRLLGTVRTLTDDPEAPRIELALLFALDRRGDYLAHFDTLGLSDPRDPLAIIARRWRTPLGDLLAEPRVIGIGLPKTATTSLAHALTQLDYFTADHHSPISTDYVTLDDAIFYDAVTDCGAALHFEAAYFRFPKALFILTDRPFDSWESSLSDHHARFNGDPDFNRVRTTRAAFPDTFRHGTGQRLVHFETLFNTPDAATAHARHRARVAHFFADKPPEKLLRFDVFTGDGWPELCAFLGKPVPETPFPRANVAR